MSATQTIFTQSPGSFATTGTQTTQTINTLNLIKQENATTTIDYFKMNRALNPRTINPVNIDQHLKNARQKRMNKQRYYSDHLLLGDMIDARRHQIRMLRNARVIQKFENTPPVNFKL